MRKWRVYCRVTDDKARVTRRGGLAYCDWSGGARMAETQALAELKPCPRCGGPVDAFEWVYRYS